MSLQPKTTSSTSHTIVAIPTGGSVQQSQDIETGDGNVAASTSTAVVGPGGAATRTTAAAASQGNVAAIETTTSMTATGKPVQVENDPRCRLMFYLNCVSCVVQDFESTCKELLGLSSEEEVWPLIDYENCKKLSTNQFDQILLIGDQMKPVLFINNCFFQNEEMCGDLSNQFYEIKEVEKMLAIHNEVIIKGETKSVTKIMCYDATYLEKKYYEPMRLLSHRLKSIKDGSAYSVFSENHTVNLLLSIICPLWVIFWIVLCIVQQGSDDTSSHQDDRSDQ